jgi:hypothetical protein
LHGEHERSTEALSLDQLAKRAGRTGDQSAAGIAAAAAARLMRPTQTGTQEQENIGLGRPPNAGPFGAVTPPKVNSTDSGSGLRIPPHWIDRTAEMSGKTTSIIGAPPPTRKR